LLNQGILGLCKDITQGGSIQGIEVSYYWLDGQAIQVSAQIVSGLLHLQIAKDFFVEIPAELVHAKTNGMEYLRGVQ
jgi:hypothetical protein